MAFVMSQAHRGLPSLTVLFSAKILSFRVEFITRACRRANVGRSIQQSWFFFHDRWSNASAGGRQALAGDGTVGGRAAEIGGKERKTPRWGRTKHLQRGAGRAVPLPCFALFGIGCGVLQAGALLFRCTIIWEKIIVIIWENSFQARESVSAWPQSPPMCAARMRRSGIWEVEQRLLRALAGGASACITRCGFAS
jgi:hypothetical protein